jgi:hypothetical protein
MKNPMGANSFDKLQDAGNLGTKQLTDDQINSNLELRITKLKTLLLHLEKVSIATSNLFKLSKSKQVAIITVVLADTKKLIAGKSLPLGSKSHLVACVNEMTSLKEGLFLDYELTSEDLILNYVSKAHTSIQNLINVSLTRKEKLQSASNNPYDSSEFYKLASEVIERNSLVGDNLVSGLEKEPFILARVPVIPADSFISIDKLKKAGINCDSISGYASINNQLVVGISSKLIDSKTTVTTEANRLLKELEKSTKTKLHFVSSKASAFRGRSWFWIMSSKELDLLATACKDGQVNIQQWGLAF